MRITVMDGQGGRLGQALVEAIVTHLPQANLTAVGLNSEATKAMLKAGAPRAATGDNAAIVACRKADVIIGPIGIAIADSLIGEVSPAVANAVGESDAKRILIPMNLCDTYIPGVNASSAALIRESVQHLSKIAEEFDTK